MERMNKLIKKLKLKFGRGKDTKNEVIDLTSITVFVGPNNSGKSKILREVFNIINSGQMNSTDVIIDEIEFEELSDEIFENTLSYIVVKPNQNDSVQIGGILIGKNGNRTQIDKKILKEKVMNRNLHYITNYYLKFLTVFLDGQNRMNLVQQQGAGDLQQDLTNSFGVLFKDDALRKKLRKIVYDAFGLYFVIDPTHLGLFKIRLSAVEPITVEEERGIDSRAVEFHSKAQLIDYASDGVKAFIGMMIEIIAGNPSIILIDEPEAFLHPPLAYKLGSEIARAVTGTKKRIMVSTHSSNFVMGCVQSGVPVNIVRLTYKNGNATSRILNNTDLLNLMRNPLLRSTGTLNALFYEYVIVTESDSDRAFYQEINDRLLRFNSEFGIPNCLFINAQNKQTVQVIIKPLRELGIPAAAIVDIDIIKEGGTVWSSFLEAGDIPTIERQSLGGFRSDIYKKVKDMGIDIKNGGISKLDKDDRNALNNLLDKLGEYGLFVVRDGELESWLSYLEVKGHGSKWLVNIFEKMGDDPSMDTYVKPNGDDVWQFMSSINKWFLNPIRKGIPE